MAQKLRIFIKNFGKKGGDKKREKRDKKLREKREKKI